MSRKFRKPKPISEARRAAARANGARSHGPVTPEGKAKSALNAITHGLTAGTLVLTTESKEKYEALLESYRAEYDPQGQTEHDLVEEVAAAKWLHRRALAMITALLDVTMDRMEKEIVAEFENIDNAARTALAFAKEADETGTLNLLHRYAARHARDYHRALDKLRQIQNGKRERSDGPDATNSKLATSHQSLATEQLPPRTCHRPLATGHCSLPNEPKPDATPDPSIVFEPPLATIHQPLAPSSKSTPPQPGWQS